VKKHGLQRAVKRGTERLLAGAGLVAAAPAMAAVSLAIRSSMGSPVLFRQNRTGAGGTSFVLLKFRTLTDQCDAQGNPLPDEARLTAVGEFLRNTSLDELPQLINILKGEMSLVGPRPLLERYLPRYSEDQARRHEVLPGLTGWAQVKGRNALDWESKFELDLWYVDHWSILLDLRIILLTIKTLVRSEGVSAEGHATMPEFMGQEDPEAS
jgi:lipopolysaccharide/colanic/teichoic acid biosynthesis glycosyltransferase